MAYHLIAYFAVFLPAVILIYQLTPQKFRWMTLLAADYLFFWMLSGKLIVYLLAATLMCHDIGLWLDKINEREGLSQKERVRKKRYVLALGIFVQLTILLVLKYFNFFGENISALLNALSFHWEYETIEF